MAVWDAGKGGCIPSTCCEWLVDPRRVGSGG